MKKIYNYSQFNMNERGVFNWIKQSLSKLTGWSKDFLMGLGKFGKIQSGPRKGSPYVMLFVPENGSIVEQLRNYMSFRGANENLDVNEAKVELASTDYINVSATTLKQEILDYFNIKTTMADYYAKPQGDRDPKDTARGMKAKPIFIYGAPGIGKTEIVAQCCDKLTIPLLFLDVQFMNPEDFKGIPSYHEIRPVKISKDHGIEDPGEGFTRSNPPSIFPRDNGVSGRGGIIFMDELNRSNESVLNTMMQFIQQGRIGDEYKLPSKWALIAAGNREDDDPNGQIKTIGTALTSRFTVLNYVPNYGAAAGHEIDEWKEWAENEMFIMPELVSFLQAYPDKFHDNDDPVNNKGGAFPTPRSWTEASKILMSKITINKKGSWRDVPTDYIKDVFAKEVGTKAAGEFGGYLDVLKALTEDDLNNILADYKKVPVAPLIKSNPHYIWGLGSLLFSRIKSKTLDSQTFYKIYNLLKYINEYGNGERFSWIYKKALLTWPDLGHLKQIDSDTKDIKDKKLELSNVAGGHMVTKPTTPGKKP